jgi:hypothetical protein
MTDTALTQPPPPDIDGHGDPMPNPYSATLTEYAAVLAQQEHRVAVAAAGLAQRPQRYACAADYTRDPAAQFCIDTWRAVQQLHTAGMLLPSQYAAMREQIHLEIETWYIVTTGDEEIDQTWEETRYL